ncbi:MAG: M23 family metallopeptidase [Enhydrobacter sp.]|nr:M23 family metallopeptidase [Enhydrobacter sp.]
MYERRCVALAAILCCMALPGQAAPGCEERAAAERLLGSERAEEQWQGYLPFTRRLHAWGVVVETLAASTQAAGVPPAAMIEPLQALSAAMNPERDIKPGDLFWVHYEQAYTSAGDPVGTGHVLWAELRTAKKGTVAIYRFRESRSDTEGFWLADGKSAEPAPVRLPLDRISISSGFGMRADPIDQPRSLAWVKGPARSTPAARQRARAANTLGRGNTATDAEAREMIKRAGAMPPQPRPRPRPDDRRFERVEITGASGLTNPALASPSLGNRATSPGSGSGLPSSGLSITVTPASPSGAQAPLQGFAMRAPPPRPALVMHQGIDLVADKGTAVLAAADGVVTGAAPNGGYGNWIEIEHEGDLSSVYGHLSGFAPGIAPGVPVQKGDLIGFVGSTGRSTGPHLHFELHDKGKPINPSTHPSMKPAQLRGADLERFRKVVARYLAEAQREGKPK